MRIIATAASIRRGSRAGRRLRSVAVAGLVVFGGLLATATPAHAEASTCLVNGVSVTGTEIFGTDGPDLIECPQGVRSGTLVDARGGADTITLLDGNAGIIQGGPGDDAITATGGDVEGSGNNGTIEGGDGIDVITVTGSPGSPGHDGPGGSGGAGNRGVIDGGRGPDDITVTGGAGGPSVSGGGLGGAGNLNVINGGDGADAVTILGGLGGESLGGTTGGTGGIGNLGSTLTEPEIHGGAGDDVISTGGGAGGPGGNLGKGGDGNFGGLLFGEEGDDSLTAVGGEGNPAGRGNGQSAVLNGGPGSDLCISLPNASGGKQISCP